MNSHEMGIIYKTVYAYLKVGSKGSGFYPSGDDIATAISEVSKQLPGADDWLLQVVTTVCCLGPKWRNDEPRPPSPEMIHYLCDLLKGLSRDGTIDVAQPNDIQQVVVAYGCGWKRDFIHDDPESSPSWKNRWHYAFKAFQERFVRPHVITALDWLDSFTKFYSDVDKNRAMARDFASREIAFELALWMTDPFSEIQDANSLSVDLCDDYVRVCMNDDDKDASKMKLIGMLAPGQRYTFSPEMSDANIADTQKTLKRENKCHITNQINDDYLIGMAGDPRPLICHGEALINADKFRIWRCLCNSTKCDLLHRLENWDQNSSSLSTWTSKAVKGTYQGAGGIPKTNSFVNESNTFAYLAQGNSVFFPQLAALNVVRTVCEESYCNLRDGTFPSGAAPPWNDRKPHTFAGDTCDKCGRNVSKDINLLDRKTILQSIAIMKGRMPLYYAPLYWRASSERNCADPVHCRKLFPVSLLTCPICNRGLSPRQTKLWINTGARVHLVPISPSLHLVKLPGDRDDWD